MMPYAYDVVVYKEGFSVIVEGFKPFFYVMVNDSWNISVLLHQ
jgi:hypothetical protein